MDEKSKDKKNRTEKKKYTQPKIITESLMVYGATCNGMASGGRKTVTGAPDFCNSSRTLS